MKVFIVFLALMIIFTGFLIYTGDLSLYMKMQNSLKLLAEDCAAASALASDIEAYSAGLRVIDEKSAAELTTCLTERAEEKTMFSGGSISWSMKLFDDEKGYEGCEDFGGSFAVPAAYVELCYSGPDIFRLPFVSVNTVTRSSIYRWESPR